MTLSDNDIRAFREEGVVVAEGVLSAADIGPLICEYSRWIDQRAQELKAEGKISDSYEEEPFERRAALLYAQSPEITRGMDIMDARGTATFEFLRNPTLLDAVEALIGPEITCNPIQHIRAKPPAGPSGASSGFYNVPWHQDAGVTWEEADDSDIITCWIALTDATVENGCMEVIPGVWKQGYLEHCDKGGTTIRPDLLPEVAPRPVPVHRGGIVFMHRYTPHRSTPNFTAGTRWSIDLRYQPTGQPTGRPFHPDFVARSASHPESALSDHSEWARRWADALANSQGKRFHRV